MFRLNRDLEWTNLSLYNVQCPYTMYMKIVLKMTFKALWFEPNSSMEFQNRLLCIVLCNSMAASCVQHSKVLHSFPGSLRSEMHILLGMTAKYKYWQIQHLLDFH